MKVGREMKKIKRISFSFLCCCLIAVTALDTPVLFTQQNENIVYAAKKKKKQSKASKKNQKLATKDFKSLTEDGSYPYATGVKVKTKKKNKISYVQLNMTGDWANLSADEKDSYIGLLKTIAANFMDEDGTLPFMQIKSGGEIVANSSALDSNDVSEN